MSSLPERLYRGMDWDAGVTGSLEIKARRTMGTGPGRRDGANCHLMAHMTFASRLYM